jgi:hypothetical protein
LVTDEALFELGTKFNFRTSPLLLLLLPSTSTVLTFFGSKLFLLFRFDAEDGEDEIVVPSSNNASSVTNRLFESSSPSGNSQKSDISVDSGNSSSCCRSPSPDSLSPKRRINKTSRAPPKKRFRSDPTLNLVLSDAKDANDKPKDFDTKKVNNPFRPWGDCDKEEEEEEIKAEAGDEAEGAAGDDADEAAGDDAGEAGDVKKETSSVEVEDASDDDVPKVDDVSDKPKKTKKIKEVSYSWERLNNQKPL